MAIAYDPRRPDVITDPFPTYQRLRDEEPIHRSEVLGGWVLTRYADIRAALLDDRLSANRISEFTSRLAPDGRAALEELLRSLGMWSVFNDPPTHTRMRNLVHSAFSRRAVELLRPNIVAIVDALLDRVAPRGHMDVIADFSYPLPATVIATLLGTGLDDLDRIKSWSDALGAFIGGARSSTPGKGLRAQAALLEMSSYVREAIADHRARPRDDLLSALLAAEERGDALSEDEVVSASVGLIFAGHETTRNLIGNGLISLLRNPGELEKLRRAGQPMIETAVEEFMRYDGPIQAQARVALEPLTIAGAEVARGDRIFLLFNAANRDERRFPDPDRLDIQRLDNPHITFGYGIHFCSGAQLARLEAQVALLGLITRLPDLELATDTLDWSTTFVIRGVRTLPVRFTPSD